MSSDSTSDTKSLFDVFKKDNIINSTAQINNIYNNMTNNSSLYISLFVVIIITVIIAILLYTFLGWQLFSKIEQTIDETKIPIVGTKLNKYRAELAETANGYRRSFSFWIYINDMNKYQGQYKNVLGISNDPDEFKPFNCSPYIFLDKTNNSMYITFSPKKNNTINDCIMDNGKIKNYMKRGIYIKYIPLQRWVNIVIVCNTDSFKTSLYAYVDGDLAANVEDKQSNIDIGLTNASGADKLNENDLSTINLNVSGYLYVGSDNVSECGPGFSGLIANFKSYNYELNHKDIYNIYNKGPINGLLARLGLSAYGIRSPIYKI